MSDQVQALVLADAPRNQLVLSVDEVARHVDLIHEVARKVMRDGVHYGYAPGVDPKDPPKGAKKGLLKPGAEILGVTFRLRPDYEPLISESTSARIRYVVRCSLTHVPSGNVVATGLGSCNSREKKYRYRWNRRDVNPSKEEAEELKKKGIGRWFKDKKGRWIWLDRIENDEVDDLDNTILKMAQKRSHVGAMLNATAASDEFTQDITDDDEKPAKGERDADDDGAPWPTNEHGGAASAAAPVRTEPKVAPAGVDTKTGEVTDEAAFATPAAAPASVPAGVKLPPSQSTERAKKAIANLRRIAELSECDMEEALKLAWDFKWPGKLKQKQAAAAYEQLVAVSEQRMPQGELADSGFFANAESASAQLAKKLEQQTNPGQSAQQSGDAFGGGEA